MVAALLHSYREIDVTGLLPMLRGPTLVRTGGGHGGGRRRRGATADPTPGARYVELADDQHIPWFGDSDALLDEIEEFLTGTRHGPEPDRALATVLLRTSRARRNARGGSVTGAGASCSCTTTTLVRDQLGLRRARGQDDGRRLPGHLRRAGQGYPLRVHDRRPLVLRGRRDPSRVHTGECELIGEDVGGMAVHIGARVAAHASPGEVLVSSAVKDLVVGSGIDLDDRGRHELKGVPGEWRLLAVADHRQPSPEVAEGPRDNVAPNAEMHRRGDRTMLRLARRARRHAPGIASRAKASGTRGRQLRRDSPKRREPAPRPQRRPTLQLLVHEALYDCFGHEGGAPSRYTRSSSGGNSNWVPIETGPNTWAVPLTRRAETTPVTREQPCGSRWSVQWAAGRSRRQPHLRR